MASYTFLDLETTGMRFSQDSIIEIGILKVVDGEIKKKYNQLVDPGVAIPHFIEKITGIRSEDVFGAPKFSEVSDEVQDILEGSVMVAHNAQFDYSFLKNELSRIDVQFDHPHACSVQLSRHLYPNERRHNLDAIMQRFGIACENRHRAFDDAEVIYQFFKHSIGRFGEKRFNRTVKEFTKSC